MREGWSQFPGKWRAPPPAAPDSGVAEPRPWLLCAVIVASCAALLGTTDEGDHNFATHSFQRTAIDGGSAELTVDSPRATFFVTLAANDLGPDGVISTDNASAQLDCNLTSSDLPDGAVAPFVQVRISSPDSPAVIDKQVLDHLTDTTPLAFIGNCSKPTEGAACRARFQVELRRIDDGASGGTVRFDWSFDVTSSGQVQVSKPVSTKVTTPLDPPWTIDVSQQ